jgi:Kef-type K+ transport system membrane component KefB
VGRANGWRVTAIHGLMVAATVAIFLLVRSYGEHLVAPPPEGLPSAAAAPPAESNALLHVLLALAAVIIVGQVLAKLFAYVGQPPVIGEVIAGILLGPSLLGHVAPEAFAFLLPASVAPYLSVIAQFGVILYMFLVGLELNPELLRHRARATVTISQASILTPFLLASILALYLYPRLSESNVRFTSFALFLGVAMSITAFPVLARILTDRRMHKTPLGVEALACAATNDVTAWCLLALVVGVVQAKVGGALLVGAWTVAYIACMLLVVKPVVARLLAVSDMSGVTRGAAALVFVALLGSSVITEIIGVHAIFGAFLLGAIIPHDSSVAREFTRKLEDLVTIVLLPAFFAFTGMRTQIGLVSGVDQWLLCGLIILVATTGKFGGTCLTARFTGLGWREASGLGVLMSTRGLMELIVLNVGLDLGVISPTLFAMMILMVLVTTIATTPALILLGVSRDARTQPPDAPARADKESNEIEPVTDADPEQQKPLHQA